MWTPSSRILILLRIGVVCPCVSVCPSVHVSTFFLGHSPPPPALISLVTALKKKETHFAAVKHERFWRLQVGLQKQQEEAAPKRPKPHPFFASCTKPPSVFFFFLDLPTSSSSHPLSSVTVLMLYCLQKRTFWSFLSFRNGICATHNLCAHNNNAPVLNQKLPSEI